MGSYKMGHVEDGGRLVPRAPASRIWGNASVQAVSQLGEVSAEKEMGLDYVSTAANHSSLEFMRV